MSALSPQDALVMVMVMVSASDRAMTDPELHQISEIVNTYPVFTEYSKERLVVTAEAASHSLAEENGLENTLAAIRDAIPERLRDTAYACAVDVAAADLALKQEELRLLQMLRDALGLDKLTIAALERSAMARFRQP